ncbi:MAG: hypothetical protein H8E44_07860 [Planctomycetes bacterium]|nr:hypothetical protein [Planctomycetota bacterium]MBL7041131.1 hypothetical protein [Pirellulaceae bacterium]
MTGLKRKTRITTCWFIAIVAGLTMARRAGAVPPPPPRGSLPGATHGKLECRWLAPFVCAMTERVGGAGETRVRWFDTDGNVTRTLAGRGLDVHHEFTCDSNSGGTTIHGVRGDWSFVLPDKPGRSGYITACTNGRTFLHQFHPQENQVAVDVYLSGKLATTIGPFVQYRGRDVRPAADGSLALLTWKTEGEKQAQIVVTGPDGKVRFRVDCDQSVDSPEAAPVGRGVLARIEGREEPPVVFRFYDADGTRTTISVGPNAHLVSWVPETTTALFATSVGHTHRFKLIDCTTGEAKWEIAEPVQPHVSTYPSVAIEGAYVLFAGIDFAAVGLHDGKIMASWKPDCSRPDAPRFVRRDDRLFLVANDQFTEIGLEGIADGLWSNE